MLQTKALIPLLLMLAFACGGTPNQTRNDTMNSESSRNLEPNRKTYVLNSVLGTVQCDGMAVPNAKVKIVQTGEVIQVRETGSFLVELDPKMLGTHVHRLLFSAPGFRDQEQSVVIADNDQKQLTVELVHE